MGLRVRSQRQLTRKSSKRVLPGEPSEIDVSVLYSTGGPNSTLEIAVPQVPSTRFGVILVLPYATIKEDHRGDAFAGAVLRGRSGGRAQTGPLRGRPARRDARGL